MFLVIILFLDLDDSVAFLLRRLDSVDFCISFELCSVMLSKDLLNLDFIILPARFFQFSRVRGLQLVQRRHLHILTVCDGSRKRRWLGYLLGLLQVREELLLILLALLLLTHLYLHFALVWRVVKRRQHGTRWSKLASMEPSFVIDSLFETDLTLARCLILQLKWRSIRGLLMWVLLLNQQVWIII